MPTLMLNFIVDDKYSMGSTVFLLLEKGALTDIDTSYVAQ